MEPRNRQQRRHPEFAQRQANGIQPPDRPQSHRHDIVKAANPDVQSERAKSTGHGKKTADKWNHEAVALAPRPERARNRHEAVTHRREFPG